MPEAARLVCGLLGAGFLALGICILLAVQPPHWSLLLSSLLALGLGADLLSGALRGKWPFTALLWLLP